MPQGALTLLLTAAWYVLLSLPILALVVVLQLVTDQEIKVEMTLVATISIPIIIIFLPLIFPFFSLYTFLIEGLLNSKYLFRFCRH